MTGRRRRASALATLLLVVGTVTGGTAAHADPFDPSGASSAAGTSASTTVDAPPSATPDVLSTAQAQARATALAAQVQAAEDSVEVAAEAHDGATEALTAVVSAEIRAESTLADAQGALSAQQARAGARARAIQHTGGDHLGLVLGALRGQSPADVMDGYQAVSALIGDDGRDVDAARATLATADAAVTRVEGLRSRQLALEAQAAQAAQAADDALAQRRQLLAAAGAQVVALEEADREREEAAALVAAGLPLDAAAPTGPQGGATPVASTAITAALSRLGDSYVWGATGPDTFDCSGLVQWSFAQAGVALPRTTRELYAALPQVSVDDLVPGDLVLFATDDSDASTIHHVGLYLGGGLMVHAPHTGDVVRVAALTRDSVFAAVQPPGVGAA